MTVIMLTSWYSSSIVDFTPHFTITCVLRQEVLARLIPFASLKRACPKRFLLNRLLPVVWCTFCYN